MIYTEVTKCYCDGCEREVGHNEALTGIAFAVFFKQESVPATYIEEVVETFFKFSPSFPRLENNEPLFNSLQYKITKKQKNKKTFYELIAFKNTGKVFEPTGEMFVEELDLIKNEIRVIGKYHFDYLHFSYGKFNPEAVDWHKEARKIVCERTEDYYVLFPQVVICD